MDTIQDTGKTMDVMRLIAERHSVRHYDGRPLEADVVEKITSELARVNAESGLDIQLIQGTEGVFGGLAFKMIGWSGVVPAYLALVGPDTAEGALACGYWGEHLVLFSQALGLRSCWVGMFHRKAVHASAPEGCKCHCTIALGYGVDDGKPHKSKDIAEVCEPGIGLDRAPAWFRIGVECALLAPTAMNQQKFVFGIDDEGMPTLRAAGKGHFANIDLGIVSYHFEAASGQRAIVMPQE